jgi:type IV pilus assembly protein PilY1
MTEFAVRLGNAGELNYVYAGDLQGNLWKLNFTATAAANWSLANLSYFKDGSTPIPMFVAKDGATIPNRQPITMEPALIFGPNRTIIVSFGTGKYLETTDTAGPYRAQSVYALLDNNSTAADTVSSPTAAIAGRARLAPGSWSSTSVIDIPAFTWGRATPAVNSCDNGSGNLYVIDLKSGDGSVQSSTVGILGEPFLAQVGASTLTGSNTTGRRTETTRYQIILQGSAGLAAPPGMAQVVTGYPGRLSWREISNYQEVRSGS